METFNILQTLNPKKTTNQNWKKDLHKLKAKLEKYCHSKEEELAKEQGKLLLVSGQTPKSDLTPTIYRGELYKDVEGFINSLPEINQQTLVEAYNKAPDKFDCERALVCNQSWTKLSSNDITSLEKALTKQIPTLAAMKKYAPKEELEAVIEGIFIETILSINVKRNMTKAQIQAAVVDLIHSDEFYFLNLGEIAYVMRQGRMGRYNEEGLYNALGINDIFSWFRKYIEERAQFIDNKKFAEHEKQKNGGSSISDYEPENLQKLVQAMKKATSKSKYEPISDEELQKRKEEELLKYKGVYGNTIKKQELNINEDYEDELE